MKNKTRYTCVQLLADARDSSPIVPTWRTLRGHPSKLHSSPRPDVEHPRKRPSQGLRSRASWRGHGYGSPKGREKGGGGSCWKCAIWNLLEWKSTLVCLGKLRGSVSPEALCYKTTQRGHFPSGAVVKMPCFHGRWCGFSPWSGTKIPRSRTTGAGKNKAPGH